MNLIKLNPVVRSASLYEKINKTDECVGYESRILYMVSGDINLSVNGEKPSHLTPGQLVYIPAGVPYKMKGQYLRCVVITFDPTDELPDPEEPIPSVPVVDFNEAQCHSVEAIPPLDKPLFLADMEAERDTFLRMCEIFTSGEGCYRAQLSAMVKLIILKLIESTDENALPARMVEALDSYIRENISDEISNTELGAIFGYHPFYISKLLKDKKGQTLHQYVIAYRFKLAKRLLQLTSKSISEIAEECGFTDASYFTKSFKASFGVTPKEFRNSSKSEYL